MITRLLNVKANLLFSSHFIATIYLVEMCIWHLPLEMGYFPTVKVLLMSLAPIFLLLKVPFISKAFIWGILYWGMCYFSALFAGDMRFSTLGFLGMYISSYVMFYNLIYSGAFRLSFFSTVLKYLILSIGIVLISQQICILVGVRIFPPVNLIGQGFTSVTKLPSLTLEPSHTARILTVAMLAYLRCWEIKNGSKMTIDKLISPNHKLVSILFLWTMLTQGSGTGYIGLGVVGFYFITRQTAFYIIPFLIFLFALGNFLEVEQFKRPVKLIEATMTSKGNIKEIRAADGSGALRIIPLVNTITKTDLTKSETWLGTGTVSLEDSENSWRRNDIKLEIIDQYGLIAFIISIILVYSCMIKSFLSLETLIFVGLLGCSLSNIYYGWGCVMIFTVVRYFQEQKEQGILELDKDE